MEKIDHPFEILFHVTVSVFRIPVLNYDHSLLSLRQVAEFLDRQVHYEAEADAVPCSWLVPQTECLEQAWQAPQHLAAVVLVWLVFHLVYHTWRPACPVYPVAGSLRAAGQGPKDRHQAGHRRWGLGKGHF